MSRAKRRRKADKRSRELSCEKMPEKVPPNFQANFSTDPLDSGLDAVKAALDREYEHGNGDPRIIEYVHPREYAERMAAKKTKPAT